MNVDEMKTSARDASDFLKSLANEHRLMILCLLLQGEKSVTQLDELLGLRQPNLSQHLARLRAEGLVASRRDGNFIRYSIKSAKAARLVETVYDLFCESETASPCAPLGPGNGMANKMAKQMAKKMAKKIESEIG